MERYIGITGFKTREEIEVCKNVAGKEPIIMYGVLTTQNMLLKPNIVGTRRPSLQQLPKLLEYIPKDTLATLHHCGNNREFSKELDIILTYENIYHKGLVKAVQINQRLPEIKQLEYIKKNYPELQIVFQLEPEDLENPKKTGKILNDYDGLAEYIIIDPSRGIGKELDLTESLKMLNEIKINAMPVIAGGLSSTNVKEVITYFRKNYGDNICIDAEGRLRTIQDRLDLEKMTSYLNEAYKGYQ